jgi:hypothetical protein
VAAGSWLLAVAAGAMALAQWRFGDIARGRDAELVKGSVAHFRFATLAYGVTAILALISAVTSSSLAFGVAILGLIVAVGSAPVFRARHRSAVRRHARQLIQADGQLT